VVAYIFFGQALTAVRGDAFLTDVAMALMGRYRGGSAKMAVVSSSLYGTVSGSAVANVVVDGAVTIPMMKRSGYPPHLAAAIEAVSSNGGQIMPPVMGAAAFLIAEYLGEIVVTMLTASIGVVLLGIGCVGYFFRPLSWSKRAWAFAAAALLMMPPQAWLPELAADAMGLAAGLALLGWERRARATSAAARDVAASPTARR